MGKNILKSEQILTGFFRHSGKRFSEQLKPSVEYHIARVGHEQCILRSHGILPDIPLPAFGSPAHNFTPASDCDIALALGLSRQRRKCTNCQESKLVGDFRNMLRVLKNGTIAVKRNTVCRKCQSKYAKEQKRGKNYILLLCCVLL
ncbi:hypothetical protein CL634_06855 [bacterium]|nr:hypothetical protein [bacterium]